MKAITLFLIYIVGVFRHYQVAKKGYMKRGSVWTIGTRNYTILLSLLSWVSIIHRFIHSTLAPINEKPSKW